MQMNYNFYSYEGARAYPKSHFGNIDGDYVLFDLTCAGSETDLAKCDHAGAGPHFCADGEQAGVLCHNPGN